LATKLRFCLVHPHMMPTKTSVGPNEVVRLEVLRLTPPLPMANGPQAPRSNKQQATSKAVVAVEEDGGWIGNGNGNGGGGGSLGLRVRPVAPRPAQACPCAGARRWGLRVRKRQNQGPPASGPPPPLLGGNSVARKGKRMNTVRAGLRSISASLLSLRSAG
jgi:hypothetical protein